MGKHILMVDDVQVSRESLRELLQRSLGANVVVEEAENGPEAVEKVRATRPDLVVVDFSMPGIDGLETARRLKRIEPRIPIILFTAHREKNLEKYAREAGVAAMVSKGEESRRLVNLANLLLNYSGPSRG
jgi:CheY-like chemotaxis protein